MYDGKKRGICPLAKRQLLLLYVHLTNVTPRKNKNSHLPQADKSPTTTMKLKEFTFDCVQLPVYPEKVRMAKDKHQ